MSKQVEVDDSSLAEVVDTLGNQIVLNNASLEAVLIDVTHMLFVDGPDLSYILAEIDGTSHSHSQFSFFV